MSSLQSAQTYLVLETGGVLIAEPIPVVVGVGYLLLLVIHTACPRKLQHPAYLHHTTRLILLKTIIIELQGAVRDFFFKAQFEIFFLNNLLTAPRTVSNTYARVPGHNRVQITRNTLSAYHVQPAVCHVVRRDSSAMKFDRVEIAFILAYILLAETINR